MPRRARRPPSTSCSGIEGESLEIEVLVRNFCRAAVAFLVVTSGAALAQTISSPGRQVVYPIKGRVLPFSLPEATYCLPRVVTIFPRVPEGSRWQDAVATAVAIAEALVDTKRDTIKVSITRDDTEQLSLPDRYYRLAEVYISNGGAIQIEVAKSPHSVATLRAYALRERLAERAAGRGEDTFDDKVINRLNRDVRKQLRLPSDTPIPATFDHDYVSTIERSSLEIETDHVAFSAISAVRSRCR